MSVSKWRWTEACDGRQCPGDCDHCSFDPDDYISRADAIEAVLTYFIPRSHTGERGEHEEDFVRTIFKALPSADADGEDLIIKGAKGIQDGLYNIKDGKLFKYKANGGTVRTYPIVPSADAEWIPCPERLPSESGWYLITVQGCEKVADMEWYYSECDAWNGVSSEQQVIAWMPLPKPYKGGDDE